MDALVFPLINGHISYTVVCVVKHSQHVSHGTGNIIPNSSVSSVIYNI